jgi:hypothetical protein
MKSRNIILKSTLVVAVMLSATIIFAQPGGSSGGGSGSGGPPPGTGAPIDGGASIFLAGVVAYAHRKLKANQQLQIKIG